ncbi:uncharacterized protein LOC110984483 isoform X1 [Acanthaster planci]|uniref:Uncharacterized protein LOC110984483 isoform X1 n=1 Tax=Acanthaster planci TaxID=133434 RepID=A0A8B7Z449_ACAPL|nr:uncharacterized protein LOC110984483 isoform X1 [Acanthaster planci]
MIGTVVICLPCKHTERTLTVEHKGVKEKFLFANLSNDQSKIQWAAFYSDCVHEIVPVEEGSRITITYNVLKQEEDSYICEYGLCQRQSFSTGPMVAADNKSTLDNIVSDVSNISAKVKRASYEHLGIFLQHRYTMAALAAGNLKGCDQVLYEGLQARGLPCHPLTVLVHQIENPDEEDCFEETRDVFLLSQEVMDYVKKNGPRPSLPFPGQALFIREWTEETFLISEETTEAEYCGNCTEGGETESLYLQSALVIGTPEQGKAKGGPSKKN